MLVVHELPEAPHVYQRALERLARDARIQPIGTGTDAGSRVALLRLVPGP